MIPNIVYAAYLALATEGTLDAFIPAPKADIKSTNTQMYTLFPS
jgi:hypothetical protein